MTRAYFSVLSCPDCFSAQAVFESFCFYATHICIWRLDDGNFLSVPHSSERNQCPPYCNQCLVEIRIVLFTWPNMFSIIDLFIYILFTEWDSGWNVFVYAGSATQKKKRNTLNVYRNKNMRAVRHCISKKYKLQLPCIIHAWFASDVFFSILCLCVNLYFIHFSAVMPLLVEK